MPFCFQRCIALLSLSLISAFARPQILTDDGRGMPTLSPTVTFANPSGYSTATYNNAATPVPASRPSNWNRTDQALAALWNQVGPITPPKREQNGYAGDTAELNEYPGPGDFHALVASRDQNLTSKKLPTNFMWGVASSAYQIEGAAKFDGKGPSIWDLLSHRVPNFAQDNTTGDVVAEHYFLYRQDIRRLKNLGIPTFSPSISWSRLFPFGHGAVNEAGMTHYDEVIKELIFREITPIITLFHWDTPLALFNEYGAWTSPRIVDDFFEYAKFVIQRYDRYVPVWFTINEPQYCNWQYSTWPDDGSYWPKFGNWSDGAEGKARRRFLCGHHTLLAHAKVAKWYHEEFKGRGRISFKNSGNFYEPRSDSARDVESAKRNYDFSIGWFGGPWMDGDYPQSLKTTLGSLLPVLTGSEKALIKGSCDFYAIDAYTSYSAFASDSDTLCYGNSSMPGWPECAPSSQMTLNGFPLGPSSDPVGVPWLKSTPGGLRKFLKYITTELHPSIPDIVVSEFGFAEPFESRLTDMTDILWDLRRADYFQNYLDAILQSILYDNVNVTGAWAWSIYDNYEWNSGLSARFGLQYVNYTDLTRTPKASMFQVLNWFREHAR